MKRFEVLGLGFLICTATLPSCAHVEQFTQSRGRVESQKANSQDSPYLDSGLSTPNSGASQHSTNSAPDEEVTQISHERPSPVDESVKVDPVSLLPTLSALDSGLATSPPPAPLPDGENSQPIPALQLGSLTLEDLEQMALEFNPTLQQAAAVVDKGRGIRQQVGLYPNPTVGYFGQEIGDNNTAGQQGGFVGQTIVTGDKLRLNRAVAGWDIEALSWEYQAQEYRVLNDVRLRYFDVLGSQRRVSIAENLVFVAETGVKTAQDLFEAKQGARPDVLQAQVDLNEVQIILQNARYDYDAAWKQLTAVLGQPELAMAQLEGTLLGDVPQYEWETTYAELLENSPVLQAANSRVQRARAQLRRQEVQPIPNLQTQLGAAHDFLSGFDEVNVQVGVSLPVFNRNQGNIALAQAEYNRAFRDVERLQLNLRNQLAVTFRDMQQANQQVSRYQKDILPTAKENLDLTEEGYKQGEFDFLRVLTARRTYFETNLRYVESLIALRQANVVLSGLLLTGGLDNVSNISPGVRSGAGGFRGMAIGGQQ